MPSWRHFTPFVGHFAFMLVTVSATSVLSVTYLSVTYWPTADRMTNRMTNRVTNRQKKIWPSKLMKMPSWRYFHHFGRSFCVHVGHVCHITCTWKCNPYRYMNRVLVHHFAFMSVTYLSVCLPMQAKSLQFCLHGKQKCFCLHWRQTNIKAKSTSVDENGFMKAFLSLLMAILPSCRLGFYAVIRST